MSDWVEELKKSDEASRRARRQEEEWQLRCDRMIVARAPDLWAEVVEQAKRDVKKLAEAFPDDPSKHIETSMDEHVFVLTRTVPFPMEIRARWIEDALLIGIEVRSRRGYDAPSEKTRHEIRFKIDGNDNLLMVPDGRGNSSVEKVAEWLVRKLL